MQLSGKDQHNYQFPRRQIHALDYKQNTVPIYRGNPNKSRISFMINVAWGNEYLPEILRILNTYNSKATFFLEGSWVSASPEQALSIRDAGHEIGNHAYSHQDMRDLSQKQIQLELRKTNAVIKKQLGIKPLLFTPPYGYLDQRVVTLTAYEGMTTILWTLDTLDWKIEDEKEIITRIVPNLKNGSIILMHPTESSTKALPQILEAAIQKSYQIVTVGQLLS